MPRRAGRGHGTGPSRHPFRLGPRDCQAWSLGDAKPPRTARQAIDRIAADMAAFVHAESVDHMIVLNVASTEPPFPLGAVHQNWDTLNAELADGGPGAAFPPARSTPWPPCDAAIPILTSHPAWAPRCPRSTSWPRSTGSIYAGKDGKTGETLMKTVLAPMFAASQSQGHELGRPQHLRQSRRPGARRSRPTSLRRSKPRIAS